MGQVEDFLQKHDLKINVVDFKTLTRTAQEAATTIGCEVAQIAKTLIFKTKQSHKPVCVIASSPNRVSESLIASPIGHLSEMTPFIDEDLFSFETVWAAARTPFKVFEITPHDMLKITNGKKIKVK
jgi:prolyl-tRNA editing enzyme YbaK/EbsC (Cys-tRNA(Pro) deacylase)